jgi:hypothetical protein
LIENQTSEINFIQNKMFEYVSGAVEVTTMILPDGRKIVMFSDIHHEYVNCKHVNLTLAKELKLLFKSLPDVKFDLFFESVDVSHSGDVRTKFSERAGIMDTYTYKKPDVLMQMQTEFDRCFYSNPQSHSIKRTSYPNCEPNVWYHDINIRNLGNICNIYTAISKMNVTSTLDSLRNLIKVINENTLEYKRDETLISVSNRRDLFSEYFKQMYAGEDYWGRLLTDEDYIKYGINKAIASNLRSYERRFGPNSFSTKIILSLPDYVFMQIERNWMNGTNLFNLIRQADSETVNQLTDKLKHITKMLSDMYLVLMLLIMDIYAITRMERIYDGRNKINGFPDTCQNIIIVAGIHHIENYKEYFKINYPGAIVKTYECGEICKLSGAERCIRLDVPLDEFFKSPDVSTVSIRQLDYIKYFKDIPLQRQYFKDIFTLDKRTFIEKYIFRGETRLLTFWLYIEESIQFIKEVDPHLIVSIAEDFIKTFKYEYILKIEPWCVSLISILMTLGYKILCNSFIDKITEKDSEKHKILSVLCNIALYEFVSYEYISDIKFYLIEGQAVHIGKKSISLKRIIVAYINNTGNVDNKVTYNYMLKLTKAVDVNELISALLFSLNLIYIDKVFDAKYSYERIKMFILSYLNESVGILDNKFFNLVISRLVSLMLKYGDELSEIDVYPVQWDKLICLINKLSDNRDINAYNMLFITGKNIWKRDIIVESIKYSMYEILEDIIEDTFDFDSVISLLEADTKIEDGSYESIENTLAILSRYHLTPGFYKIYVIGLILTMNIALLPIITALIEKYQLSDWPSFKLDSFLDPDGPNGYNEFVVALSRVIPNLQLHGNTTPFIYQYLDMKTPPVGSNDLSLVVSGMKPQSVTLLGELVSDYITVPN